MTNETGLTPQTISDTPLPLLDSTTDSSQIKSPSQSSLESVGGLQPGIIQDVRVATSPIASDVISTSLDTAQRRILGNYQFGKVGALQIGEVKAGVSGQINISPDGIVGKDSNDVVRVVLDDKTGTITLKTANNVAVIDGSGIISLTSFPGGEVSNIAAGLTTSSNSPQDVPGSNLGTITNDRTVKVLFFLTARGYNDGAINSDMNDRLNVLLYDSFSSGGIANIVTTGITNTHFTGGGFATQTIADDMVSIVTILNVLPGTHNYKLQYYAENGGTAYLDYWIVGFLVLGS